MFTINEAMSQSTRIAKTLTVFVQDKTVREELNGLIDAQAAYTTTTLNTAQKLGELFVDSIGKYSIPKSVN